MKKVISIDVETDGLWGKIFSVAAICYNENGEEERKICYRLADKVVKNDWVRENVLSTLNFSPTHYNPYFDQFGEEVAREREYNNMLSDFAEFYIEAKNYGYEVLWHMGHICESRLFEELVRLKFIGEWDAPYVPIEVSAYLEMIGEKPDGVDSYAEKHSLKIKDYGSTHNPLYDCEVAYKVYNDIIKKIEVTK